MKCGECTLCCKLLETHGVSSKIGEYCKYCSDQGCSIYGDRPKECSDYQCMWSQMPEKFAKLALRPDQCGIIFDRKSDDVITARIDKDKKLNSLLAGQINSFNKEGFSVLIFRGGDRKFYLNNHHTKEDVLKVIRDNS